MLLSEEAACETRESSRSVTLTGWSGEVPSALTTTQISAGQKHDGGQLRHNIKCKQFYHAEGVPF